MENLVSVIIPVYNVEKYLPQCIESVINQTYKNLEIILVDDGSPDNCGKICDDYAQKDKRITVIHKENGGVASARQTGMDICTGDWIYFLDSDDWIELDLFEKAITKVCETESDAVVFDRKFIMKRKSSYLKAFKYECSGVYLNDNSLDSFASFLMNSSVWDIIFKSSLKEDIKFNTKVGYNDDLIFRFELYHFAKKYYYLPEGLYNYRCNNLSHTRKYEKGAIDRILNLHSELTEIAQKYNYPENFESVINSKVLNHFLGVLNSIFSPNNPDDFKTKKERCEFVICKFNEWNVLTNYSYEMLMPSSRIFVKLKKLNWFSAYVVYYLAKIKHRIDNL